MGFEPSHWNKINIHIGGMYGEKEPTLERFAEGFGRLSENCRARLTVENDDWINGFSVKDLLPLSQKCNIPIVFDFHHHKFCTGKTHPTIRLPAFHNMTRPQQLQMGASFPCVLILHQLSTVSPQSPGFSASVARLL